MIKPLSVKPIPIKDRASYVHVAKGQIDVRDGAFALIDKKGVRTLIPVGKLACVFLEPGTRISHRAVKLAADAGTLLVWTGDSAVRLYSAGQPGGSRVDKLLKQAALALDSRCRLRIVKEMFRVRFGEEPPERRSIDQLRGIEGKRVREEYESMASQYGIEWTGRHYDRSDWRAADPVNRCLSAANACLYGIAEAAILAAGYSPSIGFLHSGKARSFVFDIADLYKSTMTFPIAFEIAATRNTNLARETRIRCRDSFKKEGLLKRIVGDIEGLLNSGGQPRNVDGYEQLHPVAFQSNDRGCTKDVK